jgi:hypothetical protein
VAESKEKMVVVKNNEERLHSIANFCQLSPGVNQVPAAAWEEAKKIRLVQWMLEEGVLEEETTTADDSLKSLKPAEAKRLIKETFDVLLLGRWFDKEERPAIRDAVTAQLELIEKQTKPKKTEGEQAKE